MQRNQTIDARGFREICHERSQCSVLTAETGDGDQIGARRSDVPRDSRGTLAKPKAGRLLHLRRKVGSQTNVALHGVHSTFADVLQGELLQTSEIGCGHGD